VIARLLGSGGSQRTDGRLAARTRTGDADIHIAETVVTRHVGGRRSRLLRRERRALTRTAEAERAGALPADGVALLVGDRHDRVVERSLNVHDAVRHILLFPLLEGLAATLAGLLFCRAACGCACCCFRHDSFLGLRRGFLLVRDRALTRAFAGARVGVRALSADRQAAAVTIAAV